MSKFISFITLLNVLFFGLLSAQDAQPDAPPPRPEQGFGNTLIMIAVAMIFFYLILWRPEQKRRKIVEEQRNNLKKGDRVTAMGIIGTISKINENTVILTMVDGSKIEMLKAAITETLPKEEPKTEKNSDE